MMWRLRHQDLLFLANTLMPKSRDQERIVDLVRDDEGFIDAMSVTASFELAQDGHALA